MNRLRFVALLAGCFLGGLKACQKDSVSSSVCEPGAVRCLNIGSGLPAESGVEVCTEFGTAWVESTCPTDHACVSAVDCDDQGLNCRDACRRLKCTPGEQVCGSDSIFRGTCDETGTRVCYTDSCAAPPTNGVCTQGNCVAVCTEIQKSYLGCEYFAVDLDNAQVFCGGNPNGNFCDAAAAQYAVVASNPDPVETAHVLITTQELAAGPTVEGCVDPDELPRPEGFAAAAVIPPRGIEIFELPRRDANATVVGKLAYRVASNIPITVYQFNPLENENVFSNDASMLIPTTAADREYYVMTREQIGPTLRGFLTVVGVDRTPTQVSVTVSAPTGSGPGIPRLQAGETWSTTLERFEVLNLESDAPGADLTGSSVTADRPVVVYSGHEAANAPSTSRCNLSTRKCEWDEMLGLSVDEQTDCGCSEADGPSCNPHEPCLSFITCCADHLEQQLFPVSAWGRDYFGVRSYPRGSVSEPLELDVWRILAAEDDTEVTLDPPVHSIPTLQAGQWYEFAASVDFSLLSSQPVLLGQFLVAEHAPAPGVQPGDAGIGDPAFILAAPRRQFRDAYVFLAPDKYAQDFVSIAAPTTATVRLDNDVATLHPAARVADIGATGWRSIRVPITDGFHTLDCTEPCSVMVHGFDRFVSYGYPGGLNLFECDGPADCPPDRPVCDDFLCVENLN